jgi:hypothetical protein
MFQQMVEFFLLLQPQETETNKKIIKKEGKEEKKNRRGSATGRIRHRRRGIFFSQIGRAKEKIVGY